MTTHQTASALPRRLSAVYWAEHKEREAREEAAALGVDLEEHELDTMELDPGIEDLEVTISQVGPGIITSLASTPLCDMSVAELYEAVESRITERSVWDWQWSQDYRREVNKTIRRYQRELRQRDLPSRRWQYDAMCQAEDIADLYTTRVRAMT